MWQLKNRQRLIEAEGQVYHLLLTTRGMPTHYLPKVWWVMGCRPNPPYIYIYITALIVF